MYKMFNMFQLFKFKDTVVYVEGPLSIVASRLLKEYYSPEPHTYLGNASTMDEIYRKHKDEFIDGYSKESYDNFLKKFYKD